MAAGSHLIAARNAVPFGSLTVAATKRRKPSFSSRSRSPNPYLADKGVEPPPPPPPRTKRGGASRSRPPLIAVARRIPSLPASATSVLAASNRGEGRSEPT
ncbi:unnamed protein product [Urochloa humidicola]